MDYIVKKSEKWSIDPEEILLDRASAEKLDDSKFEVPIPAHNIVALCVLACTVLTVFVARAGYLEIERGAAYSALAQNNKTRHYPVLATRGIMYDRNGTPLVSNIPSFDVIVVPADLPRARETRRSESDALARMLSVQPELLWEQFTRLDLSDVQPFVLKENVDRDAALRLETALDEFPGIELEKNAVRSYADGPYFSQVVGYVGRASESDLARNAALFGVDSVGKIGVEGSYDGMLRGVNGIIEREIDAVARLRKEEQVSLEETGASVVLTIDGELQKKLTDTLAAAVAATPSSKGGAAVALDPRDGAVLALVSVPSYDNNIFSHTASLEEYQSLEQDSAHPLFDRAIAGQYPPGSSIKPFLAASALTEGIITERTTVVSTGAITIQSPYSPEVVYTYRDWKAGGHGVVNIIRAIADSVNTFFYSIGGGYGDVQGLGVQKIKEYLSLFGFGSATGIDIPGEGEGTVPDPAWKEQELGERWLLGDTYNISIGQGNLLVTPLQLAAAYGALANGGALLQPFVVESVLDKNKNVIAKNERTVMREQVVPQEYLNIARRGMRETVLSGTAQSLQSLPVTTAGKTGTAQAPGGFTHAWFSSFAPYQDPEIVLIVLVENGGEGSQVAVPVAKEVYEWYFSRDRNQ
ncbi:MAG: penicillin-binding protein 2 [Patescibacteria group bacterium]